MISLPLHSHLGRPQQPSLPARHSLLSTSHSDAKIPKLHRAAVGLDVTLTPIVCSITPHDVVSLKQLADSLKSPPPPPSAIAATPQHSNTVSRSPPSSPSPHPTPTIMMALRRSRCLIDLTSLQLIVDDEYEGDDGPSKSGRSDTSRLIDLKLSCMRLSAAGGETRYIQYSSDVSSSGLEVSLTVMALHLTSDAQKQSNTPLLAIQPAPLSPEGGALSVGGGGPPADAITLHVPLPPDPMTATPTLSPIQPPSLQLGELLIDLKPTVSIRLISR